MASPIPDGYHSVTPLLVIRDAARALEFYKQAFGAQERFRKLQPTGKVLHAEIAIGDSIIKLADECDPHPGHDQRCLAAPTSLKNTPVNLYYYVENVDEVFSRAVHAGATVVMPVADMFWGDRVGQLNDPFGHSWSIATHQEDVSPPQLDERIAKSFARKPAAAR